MFIIKRLISAVTAAVLALSMTACGQNSIFPSTQNSGSDSNIPQHNEPVEDREYNYITGAALADGESTTQRPIAVMIDNSKLALPQSGIEAADIIYEMVTEGGITRFMAVYSDPDSYTLSGPVRSARDQFVQFVLPLNAIYVHIGTSIYANDMLNYYRYQDIDGLYLGVTSFDFDKERAKTLPHEHCWYTKPNLVNDGVAATGLNTTGNLYPAFDFVDYNSQPVVPEGSDAENISFRFSSYADVAFTYNKADGKYYKYAYGSPQMDKDTGTQLSFDNLIILKANVTLYPDGLCTNFDMSSGTGYYIYGGKAMEINWSKGMPENPLVITDKDGNTVKINVGKSYVAVVDSETLDSTISITASQDTAQQDSQSSSQTSSEVSSQSSSETASGVSSDTTQSASQTEQSSQG